MAVLRRRRNSGRPAGRGTLSRRGILVRVRSPLLRILLDQLKLEPDAGPVLEWFHSPPPGQSADQRQPPPIGVQRSGPTDPDGAAGTVVADRDVQPPGSAVQPDHELGGAGGVRSRDLKTPCVSET